MTGVFRLLKRQSLDVMSDGRGGNKRDSEALVDDEMREEDDDHDEDEEDEDEEEIKQGEGGDDALAPEAGVKRKKKKLRVKWTLLEEAQLKKAYATVQHPVAVRLRPAHIHDGNLGGRTGPVFAPSLQAGPCVPGSLSLLTYSPST